jgi:hypothetical protein
MSEEQLTEPPAARRRRRPLIGPATPRSLAILIAASLLAGLVVGLIAAFATRHGTPTFQSAALLEIDQPNAVALSPNDGVIAKLSRLRYKYAGLIRTEAFATPVAQGAGLPVGTVLGDVSAGVDPQTLILAVIARTHDRTQAQQLAAAAAQELIDYTQREQDRLKVPTGDKVSFSLVTPAAQATKTAPSHQRVVLVGVGVFVFVTAGTFAFGYLWRRDD